MRQLWREVGRDTRRVLIAYFLWGLGEGLWMFIQPLYVKSLGATPDQAGFAIGMWGFARLVFILPGGMLADRLGTRRMLMPGWYLGLAGIVVLSLAPDWRWTVPGFLIYGISAVATPVTNLYVAQAAQHDPTRRPDLPVQASFTLLWAAYAAGILVTPTLGGWIGDQLGLRAVFMFSTVWFTLSLLVIARVTRYPVPPRPAQGYDYRGMLRNRALLHAFGLIVLGLIAVLIGQTLSSQYLEEVRGFSRATIGALGSFNALGTVIFSLVLGRLLAWHGYYAALWIVLAAFALLLLSADLPLVILGVFLLGAHYAARPLATAVVVPLVCVHQRGVAFAMVDTLAGLATVVGTNSAGRLFTQDPAWPFQVGIAGIVIVTLLGVLLGVLRLGGRPGPPSVEEIAA